jgi:antitoxin component YwqK of YwqJK toxin-antitoxin module
MRNLFFLLICLFTPLVFAQPTPANVPKILYSALEINNGMAYYKSKPYTGISLSYWENKKINEMISWADGVRDGLYKEFTDEGVLITQTTWNKGLLNGPYTYFYPSGAKQSQGYFLDNELDGEISGFYPAGNLRYKNMYVRGIRHGKSYSWYGNGSPEQIANFANDLPDGEVFAYYPDSLIRYECVYKMGIRNGRYYEFHRSGCPAEESYYKNGIIDSVKRVWNALNCKLITQEYFEKGLKSGPAIEFEANGDTLKLQNWKYGKRNGAYKLWTVRNESVSVGRKKHGGVAHFFTQNRGIEVIGNYSNDQPDGHWQYGLFSNYQHREGNYDNGTMVGEWIFYDTKGRILMKQWYDDDGNITKEKIYRKVK